MARQQITEINKTFTSLLTKSLVGFRSATWNFFEAGHGKRAADGIGAVVKMTADAYLNKVGDITNSVDLVKALESSSIKLMIFSEQNI